MAKRPRLNVGSTINGHDCIGVEGHTSPFTSKPTRIIAIEGNIAAGKSTLINNIEEWSEKTNLPCRVVVIPECLDRFTTFNEYNPLALAYSNPKENVTVTQLHIIRSINKMMEEVVGAEVDHHQYEEENVKKQTIIVTDRSLFSPIVFTHQHHIGGNINQFVRDYLIEETINNAESTLRGLGLEYVGLFFLQVQSDECHNRLMKRGRVYECMKNINLYLSELESQYADHVDWWKTYCGEDNIFVHKSEGEQSALQNFISFFERFSR